MKIGDYIRYKEEGIQKIGRIEKISATLADDALIIEVDNGDVITSDDVLKSDKSILHEIKVGDYVNGLPVERIEGTLDDENDIRLWFGVATYGRTTLNQINHKYTVKDDFEDDYSLRFRCIKPEDINSIVTKQQFEAMQYVIESKGKENEDERKEILEMEKYNN